MAAPGNGNRGEPASFAFYNNKGGVGKTLLAFNFAVEYAASHPDKKVLVIDMDAQCNVSSLCLGGGVGGQTLLSKQNRAFKTVKYYFEKHLGDSDHPLDPYIINIRETRRPSWHDRMGPIEQVPDNLFLVCGSLDLDIYASDLESEANTAAAKHRPTPFFSVYNMLRSGVQKLGDEWVVAIDTNPSFSALTRMSLIAAKELIIPTTRDEFSAGGLKNLIMQIGGRVDDTPDDIDPLSRPVSFADFMKTKQQTEKDNLGRVAPNRPYCTLPFAKIRTIVINRLKRHESQVKAAEHKVIELLIGTVATAYRLNKDFFAPSHLPPGVELPSIQDAPNDIERKKRADQVVRQHHLSKVYELSGTSQIAQHLGIGVSMLARPSYNVDFPVYWDDASNGNNKSQVGNDAVKYGLQVQNLVELARNSSRNPAYLIRGKIHEEVNEFEQIVSPIPDVRVAVQNPCHLDPQYRGGRRVMDLEMFLPVHWEPLVEANQKRNSAAVAVAPSAISGGAGAPKSSGKAPSRKQQRPHKKQRQLKQK